MSRDDKDYFNWTAEEWREYENERMGDFSYKLRWCPFVQVSTDRGGGFATNRGRGVGPEKSAVPLCFCIMDRCMAWDAKNSDCKLIPAAKDAV